VLAALCRLLLEDLLDPRFSDEGFSVATFSRFDDARELLSLLPDEEDEGEGKDEGEDPASPGGLSTKVLALSLFSNFLSPESAPDFAFGSVRFCIVLSSLLVPPTDKSKDFSTVTEPSSLADAFLGDELRPDPLGEPLPFVALLPAVAVFDPAVASMPIPRGEVCICSDNLTSFDFALFGDPVASEAN